MGWWKSRGTESLIGDVPLDRLNDAVRAVVAEYRETFGRSPTAREWEILLSCALYSDPVEDDDDGEIVRIQDGTGEVVVALSFSSGAVPAGGT